MNEETDGVTDQNLFSLEQVLEKLPATRRSAIINKTANLILIDAYRRQATLIRFVVSEDALAVFYTIHSAEYLVMNPPLEHLEQMFKHLRELCGIDEEASEGTTRWDKGLSDLRHILYSVKFLENEHESGGKVVCEITLTNEKPG